MTIANTTRYTSKLMPTLAPFIAVLLDKTKCELHDTTSCFLRQIRYISTVMSKFAIISSGSKQYVVKDGDVIYVETLKGHKGVGSKINFENVLLTADGDAV